ncbi:unnamed protein product [Nippostrongylus brasiliensis]|uniref:Secreted protein n=1 Tax=Nippostrongylus brasiliensis TaxID=27835 RepID=A0A0N4XNX3_NIPBR|nr:unnamed protein product [Nippostrongylus brasiliensis]
MTFCFLFGFSSFLSFKTFNWLAFQIAICLQWMRWGQAYTSSTRSINWNVAPSRAAINAIRSRIRLRKLLVSITFRYK